MDLVKLVEALGGLPLAMLLLLVLIGGHKGWWVYGREARATEDRYKALLEAAASREEEWRQLALGGMSAARSAVDLAKTKVGRP